VSGRFASAREEVLEAARRIARAGLVAGSSGNVSRRIPTPDGDLVAITASRVPYHRLTIDDVLVVDSEIEPVVGDGIPSSESLLHLAVYRARPDVHAVIHTHSPYASAFAVAGEPIPPLLDEQVLLLGGSIEVAAYAASASEELAEQAVGALADRAGVLLRHHGVAGVGDTLEAAIEVVELIERVAQVRAITVSMGAPRELPPAVVETQRQVYRMMRGMRP
jgi:L-fuculose-phosphate aldolase